MTRVLRALKRLRCIHAFAVVGVVSLGLAAQHPGETVKRQPATTVGQPTATASIRGHATDGAGRPLRLAGVDAIGASGARAGATTDADGRYELRVTAPDAYIVRASKSDYDTVEFGQRRATDPGTRVRVASSEIVDRIDLTLPRAGAISGRVVDENGDPVEGAAVWLSDLRFVDGRRQLVPAGGSGQRRQTDDLGHFRLFGIQPGEYVLASKAAAIGPHRLPGYATMYYPGAATPAEADLVTMTAGADGPNLEVRMLPGHVFTVSGAAFDAGGNPYRGRLLIAASQRSGAIAAAPIPATVHPDGSFEFESVPPGDYVIQAVERGFPGGEFAFQYVHVANSDIGGLTIRTSAGSKAHGHIVLEGDARGVSPHDFQFLFIQADFDQSPSGTYRAKINDDWTFDMVGLDGPLLIRPTGGPEWLLKSVRAAGFDVTDTPVPFGRRDDSLSDVEVVLTTRGASIEGSAAGAQGEAMADYEVVVFAADRARWYARSRFLKAARSNAEGTFAVRGLPSGDYLVAALPPPRLDEQLDRWQEPARLESLAVSATRVTLTEGERTTVSLRGLAR